MVAIGKGLTVTDVIVEVAEPIQLFGLVTITEKLPVAFIVIFLVVNPLLHK